ncbi:MAG: hypothetical protein FWD72_00560 [Eggerthellaceae bacterium]|nr:hypothetical protein [Eggerthellaceae bacterium]
MTYQTENTMDKRKKRVADVVALKEPDRVPFAPSVGTGYLEYSGISRYETMMDLRNYKQPVIDFLTRYEVDLFWAPTVYPANAMEVLGTEYIRWPGQTWGIPNNAGFQVPDKTFLNEDQYDEFIKDPSRFIFTKVYPARHKNLKGLEKAVINNVIEFGHYASMASFADPEVQSALHYLMRGGEESLKWLQASGELVGLAASLETPPGVVTGCTCAYDAFADMLRGYINLPMDLLTIPDKVQAACEVMDEFSQQAIEDAAAMGLEYFFIPLHGGTDEMMSDEGYRKYYWPWLQKMIYHIADKGMIAYVLTEGKYNSRLETLKEVPKGKVIYMFEQVDIARAKKVLGDTACICGNFPTTDLTYSTPERVVEDTKRMLDICMPGGGFMMNCSIALDNFKRELMDAWYETTITYGKY